MSEQCEEKKTGNMLHILCKEMFLTQGSLFSRALTVCLQSVNETLSIIIILGIRMVVVSMAMTAMRINMIALLII